MQKNCLQCGANFEITNADLVFYKKVSPSFNRTVNGAVIKQVYEIPPPKLCPECRAMRRMGWMNPMNLYLRTCDATAKTIVSNISSEKKFVVYDLEHWWSDEWDAKDYGRDFDFKRSFFEQFQELMQVVPLYPLMKSFLKDENSDFTNQASYNKNCYLIFDSDFNRDCYYSYSLNHCTNVVDCYRTEKSELCYECIDCVNYYSSKFLQNCENCSDSLFLKNCIGCSNCFGSVNLRNKKYCIFNKPYSKEVYTKKIQEMQMGKFSVLNQNKEKLSQLAQSFPHKFMQGVQNENVLGNYLTNCKNAQNCFDSRNLWDCKYVQQAFETTKDCMDCTEIGINAELLYECVLCGDTSNQNNFCLLCFPSLSNSLYCYSSMHSSNLFGCVSLKKSKYCILNKQYTKEEYEELVPRIIEHMKSPPVKGDLGGLKPQGDDHSQITSNEVTPLAPLDRGEQMDEWGEFFPIEISPFAYNETVAQEYFPLTKEEVLATRSKWWNVESPPVKGDLGGLKPQKDDNFQITSSGVTPLAPLDRGEQFLHWRWRDEEDKIPDVKKIIPAEKLPDAIQDIPDDILNWAIKCEKSGKLFRIQKAELEFYRKMNLPIPHFHPDIRHQMRMAKRNPRKLWQRNCAECKIEIETTYAPKRPEKILCEECYLKEIN